MMKLFLLREPFEHFLIFNKKILNKKPPKKFVHKKRKKKNILNTNPLRLNKSKLKYFFKSLFDTNFVINKVYLIIF